MAIETLTNVLDFLNISEGYFTVDAGSNILVFTYDAGTSKSVTIATDGTYTGVALAALMKTAIDTACTCTSTVSYSTTTRLFTFSVGAGHTLTFTYAGSNAALLVGFNQNHAAALSITSDVAAGDPTEIVSSIQTSVEKWANMYCNRIFESASYTERYDGDLTEELYLKNYPITNISRVSTGKIDVLSIKNTNAYTTATVSVSSTGVILTKDGTSDSTVTFALYTTLGTVATAINAISGWYAEVVSDEYSNYKSTELRETYGINCIDEMYAYLSIPDKTQVSFETYFNEGYLYLRGGWPIGRRNIFVDYTAGYTSTTMPEDLKLAIKMWVKHIYQKRMEESFGVNSYTVGGLTTSFDTEGIPVQVRKILMSYRKFNI